MTFLKPMHPQTGLVDCQGASECGWELRHQYANGEPFPHIIIDDFLPDPIARMCLNAFDTAHPQSMAGDIAYDRAQERAKRQYHPDAMAPHMRGLFYSFNSLPFIRVLENITGISGLIPDPHFQGAGLHEIANGGHLSVHADFNHHAAMNLERRINLLIYLNDGWRDEYGGQLELWSNDMRHCVKSIVPEFNRAVIFNTASRSNHGNPNPVSHPEGRSRKSVALYYYTASWDASLRSHTTRFLARPNSADRRDWVVRERELVYDFTPPIIRRRFARLSRKGGKAQEQW